MFIELVMSLLLSITCYSDGIEKTTYKIIDSVSKEPLCGVKIISADSSVYYTNFDGIFNPEDLSKTFHIKYISYADTCIQLETNTATIEIVQQK